MPYKINMNANISFQGGNRQIAKITAQDFSNAVKKTHLVVDQISKFDVDIFAILGMRNLSAFVGELFAASLINATGENFKKNPHQDGYPDLLLMDDHGKKIYNKLKNSGQIRDKGPFSPFENGGIEVKATCGSVPTPAQCRALGLEEKPDIGDQRIEVMKGYDWKAHHRNTNNLAGILWDFIDNVPRIAAVFFRNDLTQDDWGAIIQPREGGGRTTSVSIMTRAGVKRMYENWVIVRSDDDRYKKFLNRYNSNSLI